MSSMDIPSAFDVDSFFASSQEIKREDMGVPEVHTPEEEPLTTKRKGKRTSDPNEADKRNVRRRENQKVACRNYRMRKKEHLSELKDKIQKLEQEKEQLQRENMANKSNNTNSSVVDPVVVASLNELSRVMAELENSLNMNAEDRMIEYLLQAFFIAAGKLHNSFIKDVDELVNPFTQASLASLGYVPSMDIPEVSTQGWFETYTSTNSLSAEQTTKLQDVFNTLCKKDSELRMERSAIDKQVKQFYLHKLMMVPLLSTSAQPMGQLDTKTVMDFTWLLNRLKTNIIAQKSLLLNSQPLLTGILAPRQHASLVLHICQSRFFEWPYHVQVLRNAWDMVSRSASDIAAQHPLSPPSPAPYTPPSSYDSNSPSQYMGPPSPPTVVPSLAIPTPTYPSQPYTFLPNSPTMTPTCTPQHTVNPNSLVQSFLSSLNYGVH